MATPADQRLLELLDKWLNSLELHLKYSSLDDDSYSQIQAWPEHQRPSRWIIDLAKQKALALRTQIQERVKSGDTKFSDSLELMTFLANLVGAEHIERFIPLAAAESEGVSTRAPTAAGKATPAAEAIASVAVVTGVAPRTAAERAPQNTSGDSATGTREMPKFTGGKQRAAAALGTDQVARVERKAPDPKVPDPKAADAKPGLRAASKPPIKPMTPNKTAPAKPDATPLEAKPAAQKPMPAQKPLSKPAPGSEGAPTPEEAREQVIADAARLVQWGRKWYELAELIARMADRPSLTDVRRILKDNKTAIEKKAGRG